MMKSCFAILFTLLMIAGCGQKGPLYLENPQSANSLSAGEADAAQEEEGDGEAESTTE